MGETILEMQHIAKAFSGVSALKDAQLTLRKGSVMALVGENGAGKSTLMRILTGIYNHDGGSILYKGQPVHFQNAMQPRALPSSIKSSTCSQTLQWQKTSFWAIKACRRTAL